MFHAVLLKTSLVWTPADLDAGVLRRDVKWTDESTEGPPLQEGARQVSALGCVNRTNREKVQVEARHQGSWGG